MLDRMRDIGHLNTQQRQSYQQLTAIQLINPGQVPRNPVPHWVEAVKCEIIRLWGSSALHYGGLKIHTTLDMGMQETAETSIARGLTALDQQLGFKPYQQATLPQCKSLSWSVSIWS